MARTNKGALYSDEARKFNRGLVNRISEATSDYSYKQIANALGVHVNTVGKWFATEGYVPTPVTIAKICDVFNVDANWLLGVQERADSRENTRRYSH